MKRREEIFPQLCLVMNSEPGLIVVLLLILTQSELHKLGLMVEELLFMLNSDLTEQFPRAICSNEWIGFWDSMACCTLPRSQSDHHPLLLVVSKGFVQYPSSSKFLNMWIDHED